MAVELPTDWLTPESMVTLAGASAAVVAIANTSWKLFKLPPIWVGVGASLLITGYGAFAAGTLFTLGGFLVAFVNFCVLFSMAFGIDESLTSLAGIRGQGIMGSAGGGRSWLVPWM